MVSYDDFKKLELRVAKVLVAERVVGSDKLLRLEVELGQEKRQIIAGIAKVYTPEQLVGRMIIVVANLEPRSLMGLESQGMLLAGSDESGEPALLAPDRELPSGAQVR